MAQTFGGASTDRIVVDFTAHATLRSYGIWTYRTGSGGANLGRIFDKRTVSAQVEVLYFNPAGSTYNYERSWNGVANQGSWTIAAPTANAWHHILITYDASATTTDPVIYVDGVSVTVTQASTPTGVINTNTDQYILGNRGSDNARNWAGNLCEFAIWDRILTADEASGIGAKALSPLMYLAGLVEYCRLIRDMDSVKNPNAPVAIGTVVFPHPRIIYPGGAIII